jgi:light-regulated signal transduction histidine kinase (bacteriophytochrome)
VIEEEQANRPPEESRGMMKRIRIKAKRMSQLMQYPLMISKVSQSPIAMTHIDMSAMAQERIASLREADPQRQVDVAIA